MAKRKRTKIQYLMTKPLADKIEREGQQAGGLHPRLRVLLHELGDVCYNCGRDWKLTSGSIQCVHCNFGHTIYIRKPDPKT